MVIITYKFTKTAMGTQMAPLFANLFMGKFNLHHPTNKFTTTWSSQKVTLLGTTVYLETAGSGLTRKPNDKKKNSIFTWIVATPLTVKFLFLIAKHSTFNALTWRNRCLRIGPKT